jgi:hypothetical protein
MVPITTSVIINIGFHKGMSYTVVIFNLFVDLPLNSIEPVSVSKFLDTSDLYIYNRPKV